MDEKKELKKFAEFSINLGEDFFKDVKTLLTLTGEHIGLVAKYCDSEDGFRLPKETLSKLQSEVRIDKIEEIASILRVSHFLYNQIHLEIFLIALYLHIYRKKQIILKA